MSSLNFKSESNGIPEINVLEKFSPQWSLHLGTYLGFSLAEFCLNWHIISRVHLGFKKKISPQGVPKNSEKV